MKKLSVEFDGQHVLLADRDTHKEFFFNDNKNHNLKDFFADIADEHPEYADFILNNMDKLRNDWNSLEEYAMECMETIRREKELLSHRHSIMSEWSLY